MSIAQPTHNHKFALHDRNRSSLRLATKHTDVVKIPKKMALRYFRRLPSPSLNFSGLDMHLHKNRKYVIDNRRSFACKTLTPDQKKAAEKNDPCPNRACNKKKEKKSFWKRLFETTERAEPPPVETCRNKQQPRVDPDLSELGGEPYRTCGPAYIVQKDVLPTEEHETSREDQLVKIIEADPEFKETVNEEPLSKFRSAEQRILEMSDKRLHPLYKRYCNVKKRYLQERKRKMYKTVGWPIDMHEIPARLNLNKEVTDAKNMYLEFKRIEPPRQLVGRIVEINKNMRSTLERKRKDVPVDMREVEKRQVGESKSAPFDTLYQKPTKY